MKDLITISLYEYSAYELPNVCKSLGLEDGTSQEVFQSKKRYVNNRLKQLEKEDTIKV